MRKVRVKLAGGGDNSYDVSVSNGIFGKIPDLLPLAAYYAVVADDRVARLYGAQLIELIKKAGLKCDIYTFKSGERNKNRNVKTRLEDKLFAGNLGRDGCIIALGGGVTGDLAGFVAATYMRGIPFVQVPTTLLAMVDASVGGKVAVDTPAGKNMVGAFHQPKGVFIDPALLASLPKRQVRAGLAEVVKHAVVADNGFFNTLYKKSEKLLESDFDTYEPVLAKNCSIKAAVVSKDEREGNYRQVLNYGHTAAHAVEKLSGFKTLHGEAVALGMAVEGTVAKKMGIFPEGDLERQNELLDRLGFKLKLPRGVRPEEVVTAMRSDKKVKNGKIRMALPERIGKMHKTDDGSWSIAPPVKSIKAALKHFV